MPRAGTFPPKKTDRFAAEWICRFADPNFEPHFLLGGSGAGGNPSVVFVRRLLGWQSTLLEARAERAPFALLLSLVVAFADIVSPAHKPRLWVEKTPLNESKVDILAEVFPEARFIRLVREPMTTLTSLMETYRSPEGSEHCDHSRDAVWSKFRIVLIQAASR